MSQGDDARVVLPAAPVKGSIRVPGDKSVSHRSAMLGAIADGPSRFEGFLCSEDCLHTLAAMEAMGAQVRRDGSTVEMVGRGGALDAPAGVLDMGNSGTGMRLLAGLLAWQPFEAEMTGDASLCSRPMGRIQKPLALMGGRVALLGADGRPPVRVTGGALAPIRYELPVASAQIKSCVLLAGLGVSGVTEVVEPRETRDHTERMLAAMGADIEVDGVTIRLRSSGRPQLQGGAWQVPGDFSSAAFWIVAAAMRPGASVEITGVGLNPRRTALLDILRRMGARIEVDEQAGGMEPLGTIRVQGGPLVATEVGGAEIPNVIDELPLVAVAASVAEGVTVIRDAEELRVKESDRIAVMAGNLHRCGVKGEEAPDGMAITGGAWPEGGVEVESCGDHRIAMCMAVLALGGREPVTIRGVGCIDTSYPEFWRDLQTLSGQ
jgi:3-phosphoshikimate 1-carboxyvinyltransferase